ncbi:hypothetical protein QJS10_CPB11g01391 [Acorus calamus]|uniref:Uncharacterized protein n=1 Tax=Acorus calamus TaxID=4465 RepID=A0AAV9DW79_ACOCL|nr:hypothetical protein QJS10_CPB11g01391 [Acorus calamus]
MKYKRTQQQTNWTTMYDRPIRSNRMVKKKRIKPQKLLLSLPKSCFSLSPKVASLSLSLDSLCRPHQTQASPLTTASTATTRDSGDPRRPTAITRDQRRSRFEGSGETQ